MGVNWWIWIGLPNAMAGAPNLPWSWRQPGAHRFRKPIEPVGFTNATARQHTTGGKVLLEFVLLPWSTFLSLDAHLHSPQEPPDATPLVQGPGSFRFLQKQRQLCYSCSRHGKRRVGSHQHSGKRVSLAGLRPCFTSWAGQEQVARLIPAGLYMGSSQQNSEGSFHALRSVAVPQQGFEKILWKREENHLLGLQVMQ